MGVAKEREEGIFGVSFCHRCHSCCCGPALTTDLSEETHLVRHGKSRGARPWPGQFHIRRQQPSFVCDDRGLQ